MSKRTFHYKDAKSDKFWEIELQGKVYTTWYGRTGGDPRSDTNEYKSEEKAQKAYDEIIENKLKKGYKETTSGAGEAEPSEQPTASSGDTKLWQQFGQTIKTRTKKTLKDLGFNKGADKKQILKLEKATGLKLPDPYKEFLQITNGQTYTSDFQWFVADTIFLSTEAIISKWERQKSLQERMGESLETSSYQDQDRIKGLIFHPQWLPIADSELAGATIYLDFAPGPKGKSGQLIFNYTESEYLVLAESFEQFLQNYLLLLEKQVLVVKPKDNDYPLRIEPKKGFSTGQEFVELVRKLGR